ncbi:MAG: protoporphyrinogen oxidase HemJ [Pseudomonadota bacterium]
MLWIKAFHIIFMVTWFAGLFYLPRLFVYHTMVTDEEGHERFVVMERKLLYMMTLGATLTAVFGVWMLVLAPPLLKLGWMHAKLGLVLALIAYHVYCAKLARDFRDGNNRRSEKWYRFFNEVPALGLIAIVVLAIVKPF